MQQQAEVYSTVQVQISHEDEKTHVNLLLIEQYVPKSQNHVDSMNDLHYEQTNPCVPNDMVPLRPQHFFVQNIHRRIVPWVDILNPDRHSIVGFLNPFHLELIFDGNHWVPLKITTLR